MGRLGRLGLEIMLHDGVVGELFVGEHVPAGETSNGNDHDSVKRREDEEGDTRVKIERRECKERVVTRNKHTNSWPPLRDCGYEKVCVRKI